MARTSVTLQTQPGRTGSAEVAPAAANLADGNIFASGVDNYYFEITNTHISHSITVTALRKACPMCLQTTDPTGKGSITLAAGLKGVLGPLPASLYGQGATGTDIYFDVTGTGTGTIKAHAV